MRVVIAGGHGQIALRLGGLLATGGSEAIGIVRNPDHSSDLLRWGVRPVVLDLETATVADLRPVVDASSAVIFAAGAGPGSGIARKDTVDRAASVLLADAAEAAGVRRFLQVSSMGVESVRGGKKPSGDDDVFAAYLRAKLAAEDDLRNRDLDWTVLRPGHLTNEPGSRRVRLATSVPTGDVPRDDVAAVLLALLGAPDTAGLVLELVKGETHVSDAVRAVAHPVATD